MNHLKQKRLRRVMVAVLLLSIVTAAAALSWRYFLRANATVYRTIVSPDGRYKIVVYRVPEFRMAFPGQAGDAPGYVRLYDQSGRVLAEKDVEMVQNIDQARWERESVEIKLFAEWRLP